MGEEDTCFQCVALVLVGSEVRAGKDDLVLEAAVVAVDMVAFCRSMASANEPFIYESNRLVRPSRVGEGGRTGMNLVVEGFAAFFERFR